jgi:hypothetical protein
MTSTLLQQSAAGTESYRLTVVVRLQKDGPEAAREPVTDVDLNDAYSEIWFESCLRKGHADVTLDSLDIRLVPVWKHEGSLRCTGFALEATNPGGVTTRREFSLAALDQVSSRPVQRLLAAGAIQQGDSYFYELAAESRAAVVEESPDGAPFQVVAKTTPLHWLKAPLPPLLARAQHVGTVDDDWYHVFYLRKAFEKAERFARKGAKQVPAVETGAVLVGVLCSCPQTGECFTVVLDALEVQDAQQSQFALSYTGPTWGRIQAVMRARQTEPATRGHRIVGQSHGHNFLPAGGAPPCELCAKVAVCSRTSVFVSADDRAWSRAVFHRQPWQLCSIHGLNARGQQVHSLFGLRDGRLLERGYHLLEDFDPQLAV